MGFGLSLILAAAGAVLIWAVDYEVAGVDLDAVGVILLVVGLVGFLISLLFLDRFRDWRDGDRLD